MKIVEYQWDHLNFDTLAFYIFVVIWQRYEYLKLDM